MKWNDGKPFSAADVAFTFNMIKTQPGLNTNGTPVADQRHRAERDHRRC